MERKGKKGTSYTALIRMKGVPPQSATFKRKSDAKQWIQETETAIRENRHFKTVEAKKRTLEELINEYRENILPQRNRDKGTVEGQLLWWEENLGKYTLANINSQLITECRNKLFKEEIRGEKTRENATVARYLATLSVCFSYAIKDLGWLAENPVSNVRKPAPPRGRVRFLSDSEHQALLKACKASKNKYLYPVIVIALSTGARWSEILTLKWTNIDFKRSIMHLEETKNGERRTVSLSKNAMKEVIGMSKVRRIDTPYLFPRKDGKKPMDIRKYWNEALEIAKLHDKDFRFHDLRHTAASYLAMNGASTLEIAEILGHKTFAMVKRYSHLTEKHTAKVLEKMNDQQFKTENNKNSSS